MNPAGNSGITDTRSSCRWAALTLLCVAQFVVTLDVTIVFVALPSIQQDLGFSQANLQWVVSTYALFFGGFLLLAGRVADLYGRRLIFMVGFALFASASLVCGLVGSQAVLVAFRAAQGLGAAVVSPAALSILITTFPEEEEREKAIGVWTAVAAGGAALGLIAGGVITEGLGWGWVFFINVPVGALGLLLAPALLEESRDASAPPRLDAVGAVTVTAGLLSLIYALARAEETGFSSGTVGTLALSSALLAVFFFTERRVAKPLVPFGIFRSGNLAGASLVAFALTAAASPTGFFGTIYLQRILGLSPIATGLAFLPFTLAVIAGSFLGARLAGKVGTRTTMVLGMCSLAVGMILYSGISVEGGYLSYLLPGFVVVGSGLGLASVGSTIAGTSAVTGSAQGLVSGVLNTAAQVGTALGLAVLVTVASARTDALIGGADPTSTALIEGFRWSFFGGAGVAILGALVALLLVRE